MPKEYSRVQTKDPKQGIATATPLPSSTESSRLVKGSKRDGGAIEPINYNNSYNYPLGGPVLMCLKMMTRGLAWCMSMWLVGTGLLLVKYVYYRTARPLDGVPLWGAFSPLWLGDCIALATFVRVLVRAHSIRFVQARSRAIRGPIHEYGAAVQAQLYGGDNSGGGGKSVSPKTEKMGGAKDHQVHVGVVPGSAKSSAASTAPAGAAAIHPSMNSSMSSSNRNISNYVDMNYLHLVQKTVFGAVVSILLLAMFSCFHVLLFVRLATEHSSLAARSLVVASPLLVVTALGLLRVLLIRTEGALSGISWILIAVTIVCVAAKTEGVGRSAPWMLVLTPLWLVGSILLLGCSYIVASACAGRYQLAPAQAVALLVYVCALMVGLSAGLLLCCQPHHLQERLAEGNHGILLRVDVPAVMLWMAAALFFIGAYISLDHHTTRAVITQGYEDPLPLAKTARGWELSGGGPISWSILGVVECKGSVKPLPSRVINESGGDSPLHSSDRESVYGYEREGFQRTDSGTYADIYNDLEG